MTVVKILVFRVGIVVLRSIGDRQEDAGGVPPAPEAPPGAFGEG